MGVTVPDALSCQSQEVEHAVGGAPQGMHHCHRILKRLRGRRRREAHKCAHVRTHVHVYMCMCTCACTPPYVCVHVCVCACVRVCARMCVCVPMSMLICMTVHVQSPCFRFCIMCHEVMDQWFKMAGGGDSAHDPAHLQGHDVLCVQASLKQSKHLLHHRPALPTLLLRDHVVTGNGRGRCSAWGQKREGQGSKLRGEEVTLPGSGRGFPGGAWLHLAGPSREPPRRKP